MNSPTTNLIGNGAVFLLNNTDILKQLRADKSLIPAFVGEMLRYDGPAMGLFRTASFENRKRIPVPILSGWVKLPMSDDAGALRDTL